MRAISLWQPWASLFVGEIGKKAPKRYETRHWPTTYRGWLAIQAAQKKITLAELTPDLVALSCAHGYERVPHGALLGAVYIDHCQHVDRVLIDHLAATDPDSLVCGNFSPTGRFAWRRSMAVPLLDPIPWRGQQGFYEVPDDTFPAEFLARMQAACT